MGVRGPQTMGTISGQYMVHAIEQAVEHCSFGCTVAAVKDSGEHIVGLAMNMAYRCAALGSGDGMESAGTSVAVAGADTGSELTSGKAL